MRYIRDLEFAQRAENPHKQGRGPRGSKAKGLSYERAIAKRLPDAEHNPWFQFKDRGGLGYCSPDFVLLRKNYTLVAESKLTSVADAREQLEFLYFPVLHYVFRKPVYGVIIVKNAPRGIDLAENFMEAELWAAEWKKISVMQYLGRGPI